jgi:hypothetical protein
MNFFSLNMIEQALVWPFSHPIGKNDKAQCRQIDEVMEKYAKSDSRRKN